MPELHDVVPSPEELLPIHRLLSDLTPEGAPRAVPVCGATLTTVKRLVALPGSFNPLHQAHVALLDAAVLAARAGGAAAVLSVRTVDKERVSGMLLEDRLWLLCRVLLSERRGRMRRDHDRVARAVVATNRGLYYEQALALHALCARLEALIFVTGFDKIVQIFDPRYYQDRDQALRQLFELASFLVAPRDDFDHADLRALLRRPENRPYRDRVRPLTLDPALADISSTGVRTGTAVATVGAQRSSVVPEEVAQFIQQSGCFLDPSPAYEARGRALRRAT